MLEQEVLNNASSHQWCLWGQRFFDCGESERGTPVWLCRGCGRLWRCSRCTAARIPPSGRAAGWCQRGTVRR